MPHWEDVTSPDDQPRRCRPPAGASSPKRAARSSPFPADKGDVRNLTGVERLGRARAGVVARRQVRLVLQRRQRRVPAGPRGAGRPRRRRARWRCRSRRRYYSPVWSPDSTQAALQRHQPERVGARRRQRRREDPRPRSVDGAAAHAGAVVESRQPLGRLCVPARHAVPRHRRRQRRHRRASARSPTGSPMRTYPVWDASGKYLWFLASTDMGLRSQWLDMTSYERAADLRPLRRRAAARASPARCCRKATRTPGVGAKVGADAARGRRRGPVGHRLSPACSSASSPVPGLSGERPVLAAGCRGARHGVLASKRRPVGGRGEARRPGTRQPRCDATGSASGDRSDLRHQRRRLRRQRRRQEAGLPHAGHGRPPSGGGGHGAATLHLVDAAATRPPRPRPGRLSATLRMHARSEGRVPADLQRGLALPARLPLRAQRSRAPTGRR